MSKLTLLTARSGPRAVSNATSRPCTDRTGTPVMSTDFTLQPWIELIPQAVAEHVEAEDQHDDEQSRRNRVPRQLADDDAARSDHLTQGWRRRRYADAQEAQAGL